jgi:hypothetical protein
MYYSNGNSTEALNHILLPIPRKNDNTTLTGRSKDYSSRPSLLFHFLIRNPCKGIIHIGANAQEYYHIELVCDEDTDIKYGIQAYGEEAKELYKEISGFTSLPDNKYQQEDQEQKKLKLVKQAINCIADCYLDNGCTLMFKKLRNVCVSKRKITFS